MQVLTRLTLLLALLQLIGGVLRAEDDRANFLATHCYDCHQGESSEAGLDLQQLRLDLNAGGTFDRWVQVFDRDLRPVQQIGSHGDLPGYFSQPKGIALDSDDNLYVVDAHFEAVQMFDLAGRLLASFGHEGHGPGEFWLPAGIHIDSNDRIWIADSYNRRVQVFDYRPVGDP